MMVPLCQNKCSYTQQFLEEDMWSYSQQCVEESTILTQGRIILWAGGSLADNGSTVSKQVFLYSTVSGRRYVFLFSTMCGGKH